LSWLASIGWLGWTLLESVGFLLNGFPDTMSSTEIAYIRGMDRKR
jgi:hypothetical protein